MPLRNRVTPFGEIVAVSSRGLLMGNRGILHDAGRSIVRDSQVRRWIACRLEWRGRHRQVMSPGSWTELFFLDEVTALAAGHRPCAECRRGDYRRFQAAWRAAYLGTSSAADDIDAALHAERRMGAWTKKTHRAALPGLPDGVFVAINDHALLVRGDTLLVWSADGYLQRLARPPSGEVTVLTPVSIVAVLRAGYQAGTHPSAAA